MSMADEKIAKLSESYVFGGENNQDKLLPLILPYGEVALNFLLSDLCEKATQTKERFLPPDPVRDQMKVSDTIELRLRAEDIELSHLLPVAYEFLHPTIKALAKAVSMWFDKAKRDKGLL